jgi:hypothetical protein
VKRLVWTVFVMSGLRFHHLSSCVYAIEDITENNAPFLSSDLAVCVSQGSPSRLPSRGPTRRPCERSRYPTTDGFSSRDIPAPYSKLLLVSCSYLTFAFTTPNDLTTRSRSLDFADLGLSFYLTNYCRSCQQMRLALRPRHPRRDLLSSNTAISYFKVCVMVSHPGLIRLKLRSS